MAAKPGTAATAETQDEIVAEPSMDEILASIRKIIADDEKEPDDGLTERERYTHPENASNNNLTDPSGDDLDSVLEAELAAELEVEAPSTKEASVSAGGNTDAEQAGTSNTTSNQAQADDAGAKAAASQNEKPLTLQERAAQMRARMQKEAESTAGLTFEERVERYRVRGKMHLETLAETVPSAPVPVAQTRPAEAPKPIVAQPVLPTTSAIAEKMAATMMEEKSAEIESMLEDMMRPIVRTWLADNLPALVQRLVQEEIQKVSRGQAKA